MFKEHRPMWAEINLDNFGHNLRSIKKLLKEGVEYIGVIKADGYGHGAVELARVCRENGVKWFAVALLDEALELRKAGYDEPMLILGYTPFNAAEIIVENNISQACFSLGLAKALSDAAVKLGKKAKVHIVVDTGMGRVGFLPTEESADIVKEIKGLPNLEIEGLFTHFAVADEEDKEYTYGQVDKYKNFVKKLEEREVYIEFKHVGNSATVIDLPDFHMDGVRPGIIQYGLYPSEEVMKPRIDLKPVMSLKANIIHIKEVEEGSFISYGRKFVTKRKSIIGTLPFGYADGYTRLLFNKAKVIVNGKFAPVVGRICMDQCMIDLTDVGDVSIGDEVIIMGSDGNLSITAEDMASMMGTINYEIVCMVSKRVPRVYIEGGKVVKVKNYLLDR